jgi:hypothetical protein
MLSGTTIVEPADGRSIDLDVVLLWSRRSGDSARLL